MKFADLQTLLNDLVGVVVTSKTVAGNSIALWLGVDSRASNARCLWIDPPWRVETQAGIESSSHGFPRAKEVNETEAEYKTRFEAACAATDFLKGCTVNSVSVSSTSGDLDITFDGGRTLRIFSVDLEYENWHFTDYGARKRYGVSTKGVDVEGLDP